MEEIIIKTNNIPVKFDLFISIVFPELSNKLINHIKRYSKCNSYEVLTVENKGRDILPFFNQMKLKFKFYKYICHIHTKKSLTEPETGILWRNYLFNNLLGNEDIISEILYDFESNEKLGFVFPETFYGIIKHFYRLTNGTKKWMKFLGLKLFPHYKIGELFNFPAGNMFWSKVNAIFQLFTYDFSEYFPNEGDQTNDTIMHGIERIWLYLVIYNGYYYKTIFIFNVTVPISSFKFFISSEFKIQKYWVGEKHKIIIKKFPDNSDEKIYFKNYKNKVIKVNKDHFLMKSKGRECITAFTKINKINSTVCFNIYETPDLNFIEQNPIKIEINNMKQLNLNIQDYPKLNIKYKSNHPDIIKVNSEGIIISLRPGNAIITASGLDNKSTQIRVLSITNEGLLKNYDLPEIKPNKELRNELRKLETEELFSQLSKLDPAAKEIIDKNDRKKIIRAIEIVKTTGKSLKESRRINNPLYDVEWIGKNFDRKTLYSRINKRVDLMIETGLIEETKFLLKKHGRISNLINTIGYREIIGWLDKKYTLEEGILLGTIICVSTTIMVLVAFYGLKLEIDAGLINNDLFFRRIIMECV